jgi:precorrin-8X/cobalt-precorrin-8 methylmutase
MIWPVPGGYLERLGAGPEEIETRSRKLARQLVRDRWPAPEAGLAASIIYAAGDPSLVEQLAISDDAVEQARRALDQGSSILVDVTMVAAGLRLPADQRLSAAIEAPGAPALAGKTGTTRAAAGLSLRWPDFGAGGLIAIGNSPTALLGALDLAVSAPPAGIIATCPGFHIAAEAKAALTKSGLPHVVITGSRGGSTLATAALNHLLERGERC